MFRATELLEQEGFKMSKPYYYKDYLKELIRYKGNNIIPSTVSSTGIEICKTFREDLSIEEEKILIEYLNSLYVIGKSFTNNRAEIKHKYICVVPSYYDNPDEDPFEDGIISKICSEWEVVSLFLDDRNKLEAKLNILKNEVERIYNKRQFPNKLARSICFDIDELMKCK